MRTSITDFITCAPYVPLQPRRLRITPAAVGCKPMVGLMSHGYGLNPAITISAVRVPTTKSNAPSDTSTTDVLTTVAR